MLHSSLWPPSYGCQLICRTGLERADTNTGSPAQIKGCVCVCVCVCVCACVLTTVHMLCVFQFSTSHECCPSSAAADRHQPNRRQAANLISFLRLTPVVKSGCYLILIPTDQVISLGKQSNKRHSKKSFMVTATKGTLIRW